MIGRRKIVGIIAARGGSKGLPRKNVADLGGKPLVAWSVHAALGSGYLDRVILSSDDDEIIAAARQAGCEVPFVRPKILASDGASIHDVVVHALDQLSEKFDMVALLQATSPLRLAQDIDDCIELCVRRRAPAALAASASKPAQWAFSIGADDRIFPFVKSLEVTQQRQSFAPTYLPNGAVYVAEVEWLRAGHTFASSEAVAFVMPPERSIDIDTAFDLQVCRGLLAVSEKRCV